MSAIAEDFRQELKEVSGKLEKINIGFERVTAHLEQSARYNKEMQENFKTSFERISLSVETLHERIQKAEISIAHQEKLGLSERVRSLENYSSEQKGINRVVYSAAALAATALVGVVIEFMTR